MAVNRNLSKQLTDHWDSGQYPMFVTGHELTGLVEGGHLQSDEADWAGGVDQLRQEKMLDSVNPHYQRAPGTLYEDIEKHGVAEPLDIDLSDAQPEIVEGHHRWLTTEDIEKRTGKDRWLPLNYDDVS